MNNELCLNKTLEQTQIAHEMKEPGPGLGADQLLETK